MTKDDTAPATKLDIKILMDSMGKLYRANEKWKNDLLSHMEQWKNDILSTNEKWKNELLGHMEQWKSDLRDDLKKLKADVRVDMKKQKDETIHHFYVVLEDIRHDLQGANKDEIEVMKDKINNHEQRIGELEARPV